MYVFYTLCVINNVFVIMYFVCNNVFVMMYFVCNNVFEMMYSVCSEVFVKLENISEIIPPEEYYRYSTNIF